MITAVIQHKKDTLVVELPRANTDLQIKLLSIGVRTLPQNIKLFGGEDAEIDVQLASSSRVGQHLCRLFNTENSLSDVNTTAYLVQTADEGIKTDLEHDIYYDQYGTAAELINDIKDRRRRPNRKHYVYQTRYCEEKGVDEERYIYYAFYEKDGKEYLVQFTSNYTLPNSNKTAFGATVNAQEECKSAFETILMDVFMK